MPVWQRSVLKGKSGVRIGKGTDQARDTRHYFPLPSAGGTQPFFGLPPVNTRFRPTVMRLHLSPHLAGRVNLGPGRSRGAGPLQGGTHPRWPLPCHSQVQQPRRGRNPPNPPVSTTLLYVPTSETAPLRERGLVWRLLGSGRSAGQEAALCKAAPPVRDAHLPFHRPTQYCCRVAWQS